MTSIQARTGEKVTTTNRRGGKGIGYLIEGKVWEATGSYFACLAEKGPFGLVSYQRDGGEGYLNFLRK